MKIVIVDDEPPARARLVQLIHDLELGEVVGEARNGREALTVAENVQPDVVLLDIRMSKVSDIDGTRAVCAMDREKSATSVITITANAIEGRRIG